MCNWGQCYFHVEKGNKHPMPELISSEVIFFQNGIVLGNSQITFAPLKLKIKLLTGFRTQQTKQHGSKTQTSASR